MKPLLPTLKERQRYIVYEVITAHHLGQDASDMLLQQLLEILGVFGSAKAGLLSVSYNTQLQRGVLRVNHDQVITIKAALLMMTHLGKTKSIVRTLLVAGTLKKAKPLVPGMQKEHVKGPRKSKEKTP